MDWERGYYYRVHKVNGRVVREYVGRGPAGELAAQLDALERHRRQQEARALRREKRDLDALDADLKAVTETADLLACAALLAAGFHRHKRGEWRRRRDRNTHAGPCGPAERDPDRAADP
jgi:hypothetical protein